MVNLTSKNLKPKILLESRKNYGFYHRLKPFTKYELMRNHFIALGQKVYHRDMRKIWKTLSLEEKQKFENAALISETEFDRKNRLKSFTVLSLHQLPTNEIKTLN